MDYAVAVNAEARDLEKAGADVIQLDEPWLRNDPEAAKRYAVKAINRALRGHQGADRRAPVLRLRGGGAGRDQADRLLVPAAARRQHRRSRSRSRRRSPSSTSACSRICAGKKVMLGVLDLGDRRGRDARSWSPQRIRAGLKYVGPPNADPGARLRHEVPAARGRLRQAEGARRRRGDRAQGDLMIRLPVRAGIYAGLGVDRVLRAGLSRQVHPPDRAVAADRHGGHPRAHARAESSRRAWGSRCWSTTAPAPTA